MEINAMQEQSVFIAECLCGRQIETQVREHVCPACNRHVVLEWGRDPGREPNSSVTEVSEPEAAA
jgi:hypothetical protein